MDNIGYNVNREINVLGFWGEQMVKLDGWFLWLILFWVIFLPTMMSIGGFFMFRKFLKRLPKEDGKSDLDWEEHYLKETIALWKKEEKALLEELVKPVPELFRDVARQKIAGTIGKLALEEKAKAITQDLVVRGYIIATPKRDHKFLLKTLREQKIDVTPYQQLF
ncbi:hypothetical protein J2Z26_001221 [Bacillus luteolus]|nr:hypothetical protein [Cytobacillus luteolus]